MTREMSQDAAAGQMEPCTESTCEQCLATFVPKSRNGVKVRFCKPKCSQDWHNGQRRKGAALLKDKKPSRHHGPSKRSRQVSRFVFLSLVPVEQRAEWLRQAAQNLGITDEGEALKAIRRNGCSTTQHPALSTQHSPEAAA